MHDARIGVHPTGEAMQPIRPQLENPSAETADSATVRLCQRMRELRGSRGWTLEQLAQASSVSCSMLSQIERQQVIPLAIPLMLII